MSNPRPPHTPPKPPKRANFNLHGATPTRAGDNYVSSTNLGHTQQEIKPSLWGRILRNEPKLVENLIKPHLVDNVLVAAIEQTMDKNSELKAARDLLFENAVREKQMYTPMVSPCVDYCCEASSDQVSGHTASSYFYLQYPACSFGGRPTDFEYRLDPSRIYYAYCNIRSH